MTKRQTKRSRRPKRLPLRHIKKNRGAARRLTANKNTQNDLPTKHALACNMDIKNNKSRHGHRRRNNKIQHGTKLHNNKNKKTCHTQQERNKGTY